MIKKNTNHESRDERVVNVYMPTVAMREEWKALAEKAGTPFSKFIVQHVQNSLQQRQKRESFASRAEILDKLKKIQEENNELNKKIKMFESLIMRLEEENRGYRITPFLNEDFTGDRGYEPNLIKLFQSRLEVRKEEIFRLLEIDMHDVDKVKAIKKQIEILHRYGLLKELGGKWRWKA